MAFHRPHSNQAYGLDQRQKSCRHVPGKRHRAQASGTFDWTYKDKPNSLTGAFTSKAANSNGLSAGTRPPPQ
jgi:hypothetical protein